MLITDRHIISWIEQTYHQTKAFPTIQEIQKAWPKTFPTTSAVEEWLITPKVKAALNNRGLTRSKAPQLALSEVQAAAILVVANLSDKRSMVAKLKSLGITLTQWNAWKKQPAFKKFLFSQLNEDFESSLDRALTGLLAGVDKGDPRSVQLYLEMTGRQPTENERNYRLAISRIVESISRHVKDPKTIQAIADDFQLIEQGIEPLSKPQKEPEPLWLTNTK